MDLKQGLNSLGKFGSATAGLTLGTIAMSKIPTISALPAIAQKVLPGMLAMGIAFLLGTKFSDDYVKAGALGLGLSGFANMVKRLTDGGTGIVQQINAAIPLNGLGNVQNYGAYAPGYFLNSDRVGTRLNGPGVATMNGTSPYSLSGTSPYSLSGGVGMSPYSLSGR